VELWQGRVDAARSKVSDGLSLERGQVLEQNSDVIAEKIPALKN
jgi:hypothetical protein